jgi:uncharacterized protein (TIGR03086 family)
VVTPDPFALLARARDEFEQRVCGEPPDRCGDPTPCGDWTVRHVIDHVMAGEIFAARVLDGATIEEAVDGLLGVDLVGTDPLPGFRAGADAVAATFARAGALESIVDHPTGDTSGTTFVEFRTTDYTGHARDLARAPGRATRSGTRRLAARRLGPPARKGRSAGSWKSFSSSAASDAQPETSR